MENVEIMEDQLKESGDSALLLDTEAYKNAPEKFLVDTCANDLSVPTASELSSSTDLTTLTNQLSLIQEKQQTTLMTLRREFDVLSAENSVLKQQNEEMAIENSKLVSKLHELYSELENVKCHPLFNSNEAHTGRTVIIPTTDSCCGSETWITDPGTVDDNQDYDTNGDDHHHQDDCAQHRDPNCEPTDHYPQQWASTSYLNLMHDQQHSDNPQLITISPNLFEQPTSRMPGGNHHNRRGLVRSHSVKETQQHRPPPRSFDPRRDINFTSVRLAHMISSSTSNDSHGAGLVDDEIFNVLPFNHQNMKHHHGSATLPSTDGNGHQWSRLFYEEQKRKLDKETKLQKLLKFFKKTRGNYMVKTV